MENNLTRNWYEYLELRDLAGEEITEHWIAYYKLGDEMKQCYRSGRDIPGSLMEKKNFRGWLLSDDMIRARKMKEENEEMDSKRKERFDPHSVELVRFNRDKNGVRLCYLPIQFFVISTFLEDMLSDAKGHSSSLGLKAKIYDDQHWDWLEKKVDEWNDGQKSGVYPSGAFWSNITGCYSECGYEIPKWDKYQADRAIDIDDVGGIKRALKVIENIKEKDEGSKVKSSQVYDGVVENVLGSLGDATCYSVQGELFASGEAMRINGEEVATKAYVENNFKGKNMTIENAKNVVVDEVKELVNQSGAADIALGRILYNNIKSAMGRTVVKVSFIDKAVAKVSKRMKYKNEVTELVGVLVLMVGVKQFYDHKALENVRGYIVNRLYTIGIEATGFDDVLALIAQTDTKVSVND